jgi:hypothetical protein
MAATVRLAFFGGPAIVRCRFRPLPGKESLAMARGTQIILTAALLSSTAALGRADESPLVGTWTHRADDHKVRLEIKPESLRCTLTGGEGISGSVNADYVASKDGVVLGIIRAGKAEKKGDGPEDLNKRLFFFRIAVDDKSLVISDLNYAGELGDKMKPLIEGKYRRLENKNATRARASVQQGTSDSLLFGMGVNSDAGLSGSVILNERNFDVNQPPTGVDDFLNGKAFRGAAQETRVEPVPGTQLQRYSGSMQQEWERIWSPGPPSHLTPERVHGGIQ